MSTLKKQIEWTIFLTLIVALFWSIWHLVAGEVPKVEEFGIADFVITLPFGISRWWDILIVPIWSAAFIWFGKQCDQQAEMYHVYVKDYLLDQDQWKSALILTMGFSMMAISCGIGVVCGNMTIGVAVLLLAASALVPELVVLVNGAFDVGKTDLWLELADFLSRCTGVLLGSVLGFSLMATLATGLIGGLIFAMALVATYHVLYFKRSWIYLPPVVNAC